MTDSGQSPGWWTAGKVVSTVLLVVLGLFGLAMSLCGGFFATTSLIELVTGKPGSEAHQWGTAFFIMGSVSLLLGLALIAVAIAVVGRLQRR